MTVLRHRQLVLAFALALCLGLVAYWTVFEDDAANVSTNAHQLAAPSGTPAETELSTRAPAPGTTSSTQNSNSSSGTLRGRVVDAVTREPVREFTLQLQEAQVVREPPPDARTFKTRDGRFQWRAVPTGSWTVNARAPGYQAFQLSGLVVKHGAATAEIVMPLQRGYAVTGRVYDEASGVGIASARIDFRERHVGRFEGDFRSRPHATSQKDGSFVLEGLPPGAVTLSVYSQNYAERELEIVVDKTLPPLDIALSSGAMLAGRLTDADGVTPVVGAVGIYDLDRGFGGTIRTGEGGEFFFPNLPAGHYRMTGQAQGMTVTRELVLRGNERIEGIVLALYRGHSIRGVVTGLRPEEKKLVTISWRRGADLAIHPTEMPIDESGAYELHGVPPGRLQVVAEVSMRRKVARTVDMPSDSDITVNLDFPRGSRLSGRITRDGKPVANAWVEPEPAVKQEPAAKQDIYVYGSSTSSDGRYVIEDLADGEYNLQLESYRSPTVQVTGDTVFDIEVPAAQLSGFVFKAGSKAPVVGVDVDIWPMEPRTSRIRLHDRSDHLGHFALTGLEPGDFMLTAYKPGYEMFRERISYSSPKEMTIRLRQDGGVQIRARHAGSGKPLQSVFAIEMVGERNGSRLQLRLDQNGVGSIPSALQGSTISFSAFGYAPVVIRDWNGQSLDLQLEKQAQ
jgi:hypothetical protein